MQAWLATDRNVDQIGHRHWEWIEAMGWHKTTVLERLALIASEVGEAVNECRGENPTDKLGEELADIILRTLDLMVDQGMIPSDLLLAKIEKNEAKGNYKGRVK